MTTPSIEQTIERLEQLYRSVTGKDPPPVSEVVQWSPVVSIRRDGNDHVFDIELAGVERMAIDLHIVGNVLTVTGCRDHSHPCESGRRVVYSERPFGRFERRIPLPENTGAGDVRAEFRNGVLAVRVGGADRVSAEPRTIAIT